MRSPPSARGIRSLACAAALAVGACVFGFRGEVDVRGSASLTELDTVQLHLPPTELILTGELERTTMAWQGTWVTLGGSSDDALRSARKAALVWETWESIGRLYADVPVEIRDITSLERLEVDTATDLAHEIVGAGTVRVSGIDAYLSIDLDGGDVQVDGGREQIVVRTARGRVRLDTQADVDVETGFGGVHVRSQAGGDVLIDAHGPVLVELAEFASLDIDIAGAGRILVDLDGVAHLGTGSYRRTLGSGLRTLRIRSGRARVELRMFTPDEDDEDPDPADTDGAD
jgi:hypothetical protein